ncbi:MAG TPA: sporulation protein YqfC [Firmicutes bacterium]|nr:sporulation protein YqfC [Bacillota bacterium]HHY99340.1 sporulation protein YqfC [Bacillota bacterium]
MTWLARKKFGLGRSFAEALDIPHDIVLDLPRLVLFGNLELRVENHRGLIEYTEDTLRLGLPTGELRVDGHGLALRKISADELIIEGEISALAFNMISGHRMSDRPRQEEG